MDVSRRGVVTIGLLGVLGDHAGLDPASFTLSATDLLTGRSLTQDADRPCPILTLSAGLALGHVLADAGPDALERVVRFTRTDVVGSSPVCGWHLREGLSLARLGDAALRRADATATNLLVAHAGGPSGVTAFVRRLGDERTRLDRAAPASCGAAPWDPRDTTTANALARDHALLLHGPVLPAGTRSVLASLFPTTLLPGGWWFTGSTATGRYGTAAAVGTAHRRRRRVLLAVTSRSGQPGTSGSVRRLSRVVDDVLATLDRRW